MAAMHEKELPLSSSEQPAMQMCDCTCQGWELDDTDYGQATRFGIRAEPPGAYPGVSGRMLQKLYLEEKARERAQMMRKECSENAATVSHHTVNTMTAQSSTARQNVTTYTTCQMNAIMRRIQLEEENWGAESTSAAEQEWELLDQVTETKPPVVEDAEFQARASLSGRMLQRLYLEKKARERAQMMNEESDAKTAIVSHDAAVPVTALSSTTSHRNTTNTCNQQVEEIWDGGYNQYPTSFQRTYRNKDIFQPTERVGYRMKYPPTTNRRTNGTKQVTIISNNQSKENWDDEVHPFQAGFMMYNNILSQVKRHQANGDDKPEEDWLAECEEFPVGFKGNYAHNKLKLFQSSDKKESTEERWYCGIPGLFKPTEQKQAQRSSRNGPKGQDREAAKNPSEQAAGNSSPREKPQKQQQQWVKVGKQGKPVKRPQKKENSK